MTIKASIDRLALAKIRSKIEGLKKPINKETAESLGLQVVLQMKKLIKSGISPIKGNGRFPRYKNPDSYPGDRKPKSPVNLELTGQMLDALTPSTKPSKSGHASVISYEGIEANKKESGHRAGVNGQPKRPTIPIDRQGESFAATIERIVIGIFKARIKQITGK